MSFSTQSLLLLLMKGEGTTMKKALTVIAAILITLTISGFRDGDAGVPVQETITGDWTAKVKENSKLWLSFQYESSSSSGVNITGDRWFNNHTEMFDTPLEQFSGFNPNASGNVQFSLNREAGVVVFDGLFRDGRGVGNFRFTASSSFITAMRSLGYDNLSVSKLFAMALYDINTSFVREMKSLGLDDLSSSKLISLRIFNVNREFIQSMKSLGYENLPTSKLIAFRVHGIDEKYIREVEALGFKRPTAAKLIEMRIFRVNAEFVKEMKDAGYSNLSVEDLIKLRIAGVDSAYIKKM